MRNERRVHVLLRLNLALAFLVGLLVLWTYMREPSEPGSVVLFGFSYLRLTLIASVLLLLATILVLLFSSFRNSWQARLNEKFLTGLVYRREAIWLSIIWIGITYILLFTSERQLGFLAPYRARLSPILIWLAVMAIQFGVLVFSLQGINSGAFGDHRGALIPSVVLFILFGLLLVGIIITGIGLTPDQIYWQEPGVPILAHQVFLAAFAGILSYFFLGRVTSGNSNRVDLFIFLGLWGVASVVWLNQPARLTHFSLEPTPPNYQIYPFSDALLYDHTAREYLIGKPIPSDFWAKPLYSLFLTILHAFAGGNYAFLLSLQVILLALIPAVAFLLGARLGSKPAGVILALLLILRERNALALSNIIQVSHGKLLLSDVFAMGFMVLLLWLFFHWIDKPGERRITLIALGGTLCLLVLTRGHPILLLPLMLFSVFLAPLPRFRMRWEAAGLALLGFLIPLIPWFWRNYQFTGKLAFQYPVSPYSAQMSSAYSFAPGTFDPLNLPPRYSGESDFDYYNRLQGQAVDFALQQPDHVATFVSAHYVHNLIFSFIYLPYSFRIEDVREYVRTETFWQSWQGELSTQGVIWLFINMVMIALGFGYLWRRYKYLALVPVLFGIGYNLSVSIGRLSGWRFILPADWITLIYYSVGLVQLYHLLRSLTNREVEAVPPEGQIQSTVHPLRRSSLIASILFFLTISVTLTNGHKLFAQRYPPKSVSQLKEDYRRMATPISLSISDSQLDAFLETDGAVIAYGQALNPSFLPADKEGLDASWPVYHFWPSYKPRPFSRVIFNLIGPESAGVVLPMESPPDSFPDGADVIIVGCRAESGEVDAMAVLIQENPPIHYRSEAPLMTACPAFEPG